MNCTQVHVKGTRADHRRDVPETFADNIGRSGNTNITTSNTRTRVLKTSARVIGRRCCCCDHRSGDGRIIKRESAPDKINSHPVPVDDRTGLALDRFDVFSPFRAHERAEYRTHDTAIYSVSRRTEPSYTATVTSRVLILFLFFSSVCDTAYTRGYRFTFLRRGNRKPSSRGRRHRRHYHRSIT